ncbi:hypothetical protein AB7813_24895 [Tardiphaga sp. 20_F10_N6_6]|uniref:hypothetical protein n=1 Tax=Tardiphaga sp. 20_F10_N6_6 TaxID=3240788 RepID=UPI003F8897F2
MGISAVLWASVSKLNFVTLRIPCTLRHIGLELHQLTDGVTVQIIFAPITLTADAPGQTPTGDRKLLSVVSALRWIRRYVEAETRASPQWVDVVSRLTAASEDSASTVDARNAFHDAMVAYGWAKRSIH